MPLPVYDPANPVYWTLFDKVNNRNIKSRQATPATALPDPGQPYELPPGLDPSLAWLVEGTDPEPVFDADTERLEPDEDITIDPANTSTGSRTFRFTKVPLTPDQLDDRNVQKKLKAKGPTVRGVAQKLRAEQNISMQEQYKLLQYLALQNRLDLDPEA